MRPSTSSVKRPNTTRIGLLILPRPSRAQFAVIDIASSMGVCRILRLLA